MYYAKFELNSKIDTSIGAIISISNGVCVISTSKYYAVMQEGILQGNYIYVGLEEFNNVYRATFSNSIYSNSTIYTNQVDIYDSDFQLVGTRYYVVNSNSLIIYKNINNFVTTSNPTGTSTSSITQQTFSGSKTGDLKLSSIANYISKGNSQLVNYSDSSIDFYYTWYYALVFNISESTVGWWKGYSLSMYSVTNKDLSYLKINNIEVRPYNCTELLTYNKTHILRYFNIINDLENVEAYCYGDTTTARDWIAIYIKKGDNINFEDNQFIYIYSTDYTTIYPYDSHTALNGLSMNKIIQSPYTPTNKLKTLTFSDLEVLHNEESGTFALTFKINNPNEVSVSTNIHISGREDVTDITVPSGTSEWSYIIEENKDGTIQATDISALGYENADDSATYKYLAWIEPGYLRELSVDLVYLSTIDDKTYTLNVYISNNNSVTIPAVLHYGKSAELTRDITLNSGTNAIAIKGVENVNGTIWVHPESVSGYYPLPDTDTYTYTKLPIPPTPATTGITLYKNNNNNKVVNKGYKLETYKAMVGNFRDKINVLHPTFQIENDEVPDCNYCYIADFRRYYYIDSITCVRNNIYEITCSVDVLYTYKDNILSSEQYVSRQENEYNELLVDDLVTFDSDYTYRISYQNIDELDYGNSTASTSEVTDKTNIILGTLAGWNVS